MTTVSILCLQLLLLSAAVMTSTTTETPTTTTEAPTITTDAPTTSTEAPTMSTEAPTMSTEVLTTSTETLTIEDPTTTTETPTTSATIETPTTAAPLPSVKTECSQLNCTTGTCVTTNNGEEYCTCPNGYNLTMVDNVTGICESTNVHLLYTTSVDIILLDTETGVTTNIAIGKNNSVTYIAYHYTTGYVYWTDFSAGTISRKKYPLDGSDAEMIIADDLHPAGIAIDPESDHLYFVDHNQNGTLLRSDLNGANRVELLTGLYRPAAIALDTVNKWVYYSAVSTNKTRITKCKFNGSNQQSIITDDNPGRIYGISLDLIEQRIYWTDYHNNSIKSAKVDGSDVQLITSGLTGPQRQSAHS